MINNNIKYLERLFYGKKNAHETLDKKMKSYSEEEYEPGLEYEPLSDEEKNGIIQSEVLKQGKVDSLIWAFRDIGYLYAELNPLGNDYQEHYTNLPLIRSGIFEKLAAEEFGLSEEDMDKTFYSGPACNYEKRTLKDIIDIYKGIYCSSIGVEFLHIQNKPVRKWFIRNIEKERDKFDISVDEKKIILEDLVKSEEFEHFLHRNYIGQRRFSIEGAETVIPVLHFLVNSADLSGVKEIVIGTTHRGRLTILNLILQLSPEEIFFLFEVNYDEEMIDGGGDVKYHIGYTSEHTHEDGTSVRVTLPSNASHLESVDAVVEGRTRGIQDKLNDRYRNQVIPVLIHGEAAFSGQGVVAETLNLSMLEGYSTGGTIHIIINNQVGFTTSTRSAHSSGFTTDIAKSMSIPIFHVNGDDPVASARVMKLAMDYRQTFKRDIVIDILCYRKYGHNEGDDPSFTHPRMYEIITNHRSVAEIFSEYCIENNIISAEELENAKNDYLRELKDSLNKLHDNKDYKAQGGFFPHKIKYFDQDLLLKNDVGVKEEVILNIANSIHRIPGEFRVHEKLKHILENRYRNFKENRTIDWAFAESIAFGSLLLEGHGVRLSGEDSERGTFSQRHLVWWEVNVDDPKFYIPLNHLKDGQTLIAAYDSPLSEYSVLGFEFGYSISCKDRLVIWEAQFGDFSNGAQVIIDNYLIAAEAKWNIRSGLVILLPHGYEGQGPEHSNGHMERFLQLSAQENIQVCNVTTPAQYFCLLRRQVILNVEKPLIIMTPKSLLRHPLAVSTIDDLVKGHFQYIIENTDAEPDKVSRLLFCTGKLYYELYVRKNETRDYKTVIVRIEELYPFPAKEIEGILLKYKNAKDLCWIQEEPRNRGAWAFIQYQFLNLFNERLKYIGRNPSASPATGSLTLHKMQQEKIINDAFTRSQL